MSEPDVNPGSKGRLNGRLALKRPVADSSPTESDDDRVLLLCAVKERLVRALVESLAPAHGVSVDWRLQTIVWDCVAALEQVQAALHDDFHHRRQLAIDMQQAQSALARTRDRLVAERASTQRARHLALHDSLTTLPNRRHFLAQVHVALNAGATKGRTPALLYVDLDGFKAVNDVHGHAAGDELLRIVATRLKRSVREVDIVSRLGGDEFACLVHDAPGQEQLCRLASKIVEAVASPLKVGDLTLKVRPSIGIATAPGSGITAAALLGHADTAMYRAKRQRSGYAFFDPKDQAPPALAWPLQSAAGPN